MLALFMEAPDPRADQPLRPMPADGSPQPPDVQADDEGVTNT
jgi:hypothetical protein